MSEFLLLGGFETVSFTFLEVEKNMLLRGGEGRIKIGLNLYSLLSFLITFSSLFTGHQKEKVNAFLA